MFPSMSSSQNVQLGADLFVQTLLQSEGAVASFSSKSCPRPSSGSPSTSLSVASKTLVSEASSGDTYHGQLSCLPSSDDLQLILNGTHTLGKGCKFFTWWGTSSSSTEYKQLILVTQPILDLLIHLLCDSHPHSIPYSVLPLNILWLRVGHGINTLYTEIVVV